MMERTFRNGGWILIAACAGAVFSLLPASAAQGTQHQPATDASAQASPIAPERTGGPYIPAHAAIPVALDQDIDSGKLKQGDNVKARLVAPVVVHGGGVLPAGTPVTISVIATVPAGRLMAQGEFSLQAIRVGKLSVYTDTQVFDGKPGHQDLPDSAPALGTDAGLPEGATLTFRVLPPPTAAEAAPSNTAAGPGSVDGIASGGPPPPSAVKSTYDNAANTAPSNGSSSGQRSVTPADTTTNQQTKQQGRPSVAPNQPQSPGQTQPH